MRTVTTESVAGNPPAPNLISAEIRSAPTEGAINPPLHRLEQLLAAHERQGALLETIEDKLEHAIGMAPGDQRDAELQSCWLLQLTSHEIHDRHFREMADIVAAFFVERRERRAAA